MSHDGALESPGQTDTLVIYMGGHDLPGLQQRLGAAGRPADTPVLVVSNAGTGSARSSSGKLSSLGQQGRVSELAKQSLLSRKKNNKIKHLARLFSPRSTIRPTSKHPLTRFQNLQNCSPGTTNARAFCFLPLRYE